MSNRLSEFIRRVAERANGQQVDLNSQGVTFAATVQSDELSASLGPSVVEVSAQAIDVQTVHPVNREADVAHVAHISLPDESENIVFESKSDLIYVFEGPQQVVESATSAIPPVGACSPDGECIGAADSAFLSADEACLRPTFCPPRIRFTHVTAMRVSLVHLETGLSVEIDASTPATIFRSISEGQNLGSLDQANVRLKQLIWQSICKGYLIVSVRGRIYQTTPFALNNQFKTYQLLI